MASGKEIRTQIKSIQNTQKITRAMEMVAASKMRKAQDRMRAAKPYAAKMRNVISHMARAHSEYKHPFLVQRDVKRVGFIVISTDRGLCGGLNVNMFRRMIAEMRDLDSKGISIDVCTLGKKAIGFFNRVGANVLAEASGLGDTPSIEDLVGTVKTMLDAYASGGVDKVCLVYNEFANSMTQKPLVEQLLPLPADAAGKQEMGHHWDYIYEPDPKEVVDALLLRYVESLVYQAAVENVACEMSARMIAMKSASDNAGELINELQLAYNKARQAAITQEISEIVGGAAAV